MAIVLDELGGVILDESGNNILDEYEEFFGNMTLKTPQVWNPQPIGYGPESLITVQGAYNLVDQSSNQLVDQAGNFLVTGVKIPQAKVPIVWSDTGV